MGFGARARLDEHLEAAVAQLAGDVGHERNPALTRPGLFWNGNLHVQREWARLNEPAGRPGALDFIQSVEIGAREAVLGD